MRSAPSTRVLTYAYRCLAIGTRHFRSSRRNNSWLVCGVQVTRSTPLVFTLARQVQGNSGNEPLSITAAALESIGQQLVVRPRPLATSYASILSNV